MSVELTLHRDNLPAAAAMPRTPCDDNALSFYRRGDPNMCGRLPGSGKRGYPLRNAFRASYCWLRMLPYMAVRRTDNREQESALRRSSPFVTHRRPVLLLVARDR